LPHSPATSLKSTTADPGTSRRGCLLRLKLQLLIAKEACRGELSRRRFLKLIGCDNAEVGNYAALVRERNDTAHCNGNIFFSTQAAIDDKISEILRVVDEIQSHSRPVIEDCYREFLLQNCDPDEREYPDAVDQIREVLIHVNYLSQKDIEMCL
jgi:hypothetical protein